MNKWSYNLFQNNALVRIRAPQRTTMYGGRQTVTLIPGSGEGLRNSEYVRDIFKAALVPVDFETVPMKRGEHQDLNNIVISVKRNKVALKGVAEAGAAAHKAFCQNMTIRKALDLYVTHLPCWSYPGIEAPYGNIKVDVFKLSIDGEYSMLEHENIGGVVESMKVMTKYNSRRVARDAFSFAAANRRRKVTTIHKATIMNLSDGLFLESARLVAKDFPNILHDDMLIDKACCEILRNPHAFDVVLTTNLYGSVLCSILCGVTRSAGLITGTNYGDQFTIFETGCRSTTFSNPAAMVIAGVEMLRYLGLKHHAEMIREAVTQTICVQKIHSPDLGGASIPADIVDNIIEILERKAKCHIFKF